MNETPVLGSVGYQRNGLGRITRLTDPLGGHWIFQYTTMGRLAGSKDPLNREYKYEYDENGRLWKIIYPDSVVESRAYDFNGNLLQRSFSDGLVLDFTLDELNRLTGTAGTPVALAYDQRDRITDTRMHDKSFTAQYNTRGWIQSLSYAGHFSVNYTYDSRGQVTELSDTLLNAWIRFTYNPAGLVTRLERSNGAHTEITRDPNGRPVRIQHGDQGSLDLAYDSRADISEILSELPLDVKSLLEFEIDNFNSDSAHQISSPGFQYDLRGRRTRDPKRQYTWDGADRLLGIEDASGNIIYEYTASGEVASKTLGEKQTHFYHQYALPGQPMVAEGNDSDFSRFYVYSPGGQLLYCIDLPDQVRFYHFDHIGTTMFLTGADGGITDTYGYSPYGRTLKHEGSSDQPFTFAGEHGVRQEGQTGLYQMRARYYDSLTGRFISRDPIWPEPLDIKSANPYHYVGQNPVTRIDPTGLERSALFDHLISEALVSKNITNDQRADLVYMVSEIMAEKTARILEELEKVQREMELLSNVEINNKFLEEMRLRRLEELEWLEIHLWIKLEDESCTNCQVITGRNQSAAWLIPIAFLLLLWLAVRLTVSRRDGSY